MLSKEEIARYSRHLLLPEMGIQGQEKIKKAKVLVIGAGGLGCPALQYLAAIGIGYIGIVDFDKVDESNLQRQILYSLDDVGKPKAEISAKKLQNQNPFIKIEAYPVILDNQNALDIISNYDLVIDGTDNFASRYLVNDACVLLNKTLIYGSIYKFQGQVSVFNLTNREGVQGPTYRCLFPTPPKSGSVPNCSEIGVLGILPGIAGTLQATEAIKIITGLGKPLSGKLLLFDALTMNFTTLEINRNTGWLNSAPKNKDEFQKTDYEFFCNGGNDNLMKSISAGKLKLRIENRDDIQLLDVREINEQPQIEILNDLQIPLKEISDKNHLISKNKPVIVYCKAGSRSKQAIEILETKFGFTNLYNLEGGVLEWEKLISNKTN